MKIRLKNVRLSFADLWTPTAYEDGQEKKFKANFLFPKNGEVHKLVEDAIKAVAKEKWGAKADATLKAIRGNEMKFPLRDGDAKEYDGYAGNMYLAAKNKKRPAVVDRDRATLTEQDGKPYSGCYVYADVSIYATKQGGIAASLEGVQFFKDGDAFSGSKPMAAEEFEDLSDIGEDESEAA